LADEIKRKALFFLLLAMVAAILIGSALPRLEFQPGLPLPSFENGQVIASPTEQVQLIQIQIGDLFKTLFAVFLALIMMYMVYRASKGVPWKELLANLIPTSLITLAVFAFLILALVLLPKGQLAVLPETLPTPAPIQTSPLGPVPPSLYWIVGILLAAAALILGVELLRARPIPSQRDLLDLELENARQAILTGQDFKEVILQCYQRMSQVLQQEQQVAREAYMTTGEFERLLESLGIPHDPIHQLTRLFDAVRYGRWQPSPDDQQKAIQSLNAILEYSHAKGRHQIKNAE
jgi:hypothetical protein